MVDIYRVSSVRQLLHDPDVLSETPNVRWQACGFAVPFYSYQGERHSLNQCFNTKEQKDNEAEADAENPSMCKAESGLKEYWEKKNTQSLDGLPGLSSAPSAALRPNGYNVNVWTKFPHLGEKQTGKATQATRYVDAKFLAGVATGGLLATVCYAILQHAQPQLSLLR